MENNPIIPHLHSLEGKNDDELREVLSELNNASLKKIAREAIQAAKGYKEQIIDRQKTINKYQTRLYNVAKLSEKVTNLSERDVQGWWYDED